MKEKIVALFLTILTLAAVSGCGIKQTNDTVTVEAGQELSLVATDFFNIRKEKAGEVVFDTEDVDVNRVGEYEATATYKKDTYTIKVVVEDTTAPMVEVLQRYVITNDVASINASDLVNVYDASEYTPTFVRFEKAEDLKVLDDNTLTALTDAIPIPCDQEELAALGTEEVPTTEGIYRAVLSVSDLHGNTQLEEIVLVLDKTGALIEEVADRVIEAEEGKYEANPEIDVAEIVAMDNVDGKIAKEYITATPELTNPQERQFTIHVVCKDRAGNESKADFLVTVKKNVTVTESNTSGNTNSNNNSNAGNKNNGSGYNSNAGGNGGSSSGGEDSGVSKNEINDNAAIQAGYYVVTSTTDGGYQVLVPEAESEYGFDLLEDYVASLGCMIKNGGLGGEWINPNKDQYQCYVRGSYIVPIDNSLNDW